MSADSVDVGPSLEARYANYFQIGQNATEFLLQFGQYYPGKELVWITRIITAPVFMKEFLRMITESVDLHEARYGAINDPHDDEAGR